MTYPKGGETLKRITKIEGNTVFLNAVRKTRVAAYCRVSTGSDEQLLSLETQKDHYERYIKAHPDWEYAGLYYDEAVIIGLKTLRLKKC